MADEPRPQKHIFLVDDDPDFLEIFGTKLSSVGFQMTTFTDAAMALQEAEAKQPDLIILDVQMPKMSGVEALSKLKANSKTANLKVLFLTNAGTNEVGLGWLDQKFAKDVGAIDYIRKSDDLEDITAKIMHALES